MIVLSLTVALFAREDVDSVEFKHPGLLHPQESLREIRLKIESGEESFKEAFEIFRNDKHAKYDYRMQGPFKNVSRIPFRDSGKADGDYRAAYFNALMWSFTGDRKHAEKSIEILNAYASSFEGFDENDRDKQLTASLGPFLFVNAAEIIRYSDSGWSPEDAKRFEEYLVEKVYPTIRDFADFANGNWDTACIKTIIAIGVFCDDREIFESGIEYYRNGKGNGRLEHYVINESGQSQESGRDQQHTQLGLGHLAEAAEIAFQQGIDLYSLHDNRLLAGFEYAAKYNLGEEVPFVSHVDTTGKYRHKSISEKGRGELRPIYEMVLNHYGNRKKLDCPNVRKAVEKTCPEGPAFNADHPGYGTLFFGKR